MELSFFKYQGTGNHFVMIDNRDLVFPKSKALIERLCQKGFGIGADGLILLEKDPNLDFRMRYYNSDGNESSMCGNGGRCIVSFAHFLGIFEGKTSFSAVDGEHSAAIEGTRVKLSMIDVSEIKKVPEATELDTGSPHLVKFVENVENLDVYKEGRGIRFSERYSRDGINVNFVSEIGCDAIFVRTYERGVEAETLSCGTGVTASALVFMQEKNITQVRVKSLGGELNVYAERDAGTFRRVFLEGPVNQVFRGVFSL